MRLVLPALAALLLTACASLSDRARESLEQPGLEGTRFGLIVLTLDGRELVSINADERFMPASNTKLFTAAAAFHRLGDMSEPDPSEGTSLRLVPNENGPPSLLVVGSGDATLLDAPDCKHNCLSELADAVVAQGLTEVGDIVMDESVLPREFWPPGWSHEDLVRRSGAPVSALTVNSNELRITVTPAARAGDPATVTWVERPPGYTLDAAIVTIDDAKAEFTADLDPSPVIRVPAPEETVVRLAGFINLTGPPVNLAMAVRDPAHTAGMRFKALLDARGIKTGSIGIRFSTRGAAGLPMAHEPLEGVEIARLIPPPLIENVTFLMKQSQNLHAELLLRRLGLVEGDGSREAGLKIVEAMLAETGAPRWSWDFWDGSGMSVYNRVTPRTTAALLLWTARQSWAEAFRDTLPIGGVDGTLRRRFEGTSLEGRIFAKTGTLRGTNALSGFMLTKSGQLLVFSAYANERPSSTESAIWALDATLVAISETN